MEEDVFPLYVLLITIVACIVVAVFKKKGSARQRAGALLCVVLGFVALAVEVLSWMAAARTTHGEVWIVFGGSIAFWIIAGYLYKKAKSAKSVAVELAGLGRSDAEAASIYAECLKEDLDCGEDVLEAACKTFREHGRHEDTAEAAARILEKKPESGDALAALVGAYVELGKHKDAERASARFAKANPDSEIAALTHQKIKAISAEAVADVPTRTLVDVARDTASSDLTPIKVKRYARQIVTALGAIDPAKPPPAVTPEEMTVSPHNDIEFRPSTGIPELRGEFTPPEGPLRADALGPGLVYTAGQLVYYLLTKGQTVAAGEKPASLRRIVDGLSGSMEKTILSACDVRPTKRPGSLDALSKRIQAG